jgi:type I restriction enzyme M protein
MPYQLLVRSLFLLRAACLFHVPLYNIVGTVEAGLTSMSAADSEIELEDKDNYSGKYFYIPPRARWNEGWVPCNV